MDVETEAPALHQRICQVLTEQKAKTQSIWLESLLQDGQLPRIDRTSLDDICSRLLDELFKALVSGAPDRERVLPPTMCDLLSGISIDFVERGFTPSHTARFIFSLKHQLYALFSYDVEALCAVHELIDSMGLYSMDAFILRREQIIGRQTQELLDISVPVVPLWEGVLSMPIIGTIDSVRAQAITETLLFELARTASRYAVLDISGVPMVDTQTAQHLAKTVAAARLMGAECVITGIRPSIAQVMVALGINLMSIQTRFSLAEGLRYCFAQLGISVTRRES